MLAVLAVRPVCALLTVDAQAYGDLKRLLWVPDVFQLVATFSLDYKVFFLDITQSITTVYCFSNRAQLDLPIYR